MFGNIELILDSCEAMLDFSSCNSFCISFKRLRTSKKGDSLLWVDGFLRSPSASGLL